MRLRLPLSELVNFGVVEHLSIVTLGDYVREPDILVWPEADVVNFWYIKMRWYMDMKKHGSG